MGRKLRVQYPGAIYHVMNRGDRREEIFRDDQDRGRFLSTLAEACAKTGWEVHSYNLLGNHFHLVLETPRANLVTGMKWLLGTYTSRFNRRYRLTGHVFAGRYKALIVDQSGDGYFRTVCDYVHLNPSRAKLIGTHQPLRDYKWSSWPGYLRPDMRPPWLRVDRLLGEYGIRRDNAAGRRWLEECLERRRTEEQASDYQELRRGWFFGEDELKHKLLEGMHDAFGPNHDGKERWESAEEHAKALLAKELKLRGWTQKDLEKRRKSDPEKVRMARRLRAETTMTLKWIAERLKMGSVSMVKRCLRNTGR